MNALTNCPEIDFNVSLSFIRSAVIFFCLLLLLFYFFHSKFFDWQLFSSSMRFFSFGWYHCVCFRKISEMIYLYHGTMNEIEEKECVDTPDELNTDNIDVCMVFSHSWLFEVISSSYLVSGTGCVCVCPLFISLYRIWYCTVSHACTTTLTTKYSIEWISWQFDEFRLLCLVFSCFVHWIHNMWLNVNVCLRWNRIRNKYTHTRAMAISKSISKTYLVSCIW